MAPPSIHPNGTTYHWLAEPHGRLPRVPSWLISSAAPTAGQGVHRAAKDLVPHGARHGYLADFATRLVRAGVLDEDRIAVHLCCEFELSCAPTPPPKVGYFEALAKWAARTRIAQREAANSDPPELSLLRRLAAPGRIGGAR